MSARAGILGIFMDYEGFLAALRDLKAMEVEEISTFAPVPCHEVDAILGERKSPIRILTLMGGLVGFAAGAALTVFATTAYPMIVGGKPLISVPPYLIIAFELTILLATVLTMVGYFVLSPITGPRAKRCYDPSFSEDRFGISAASGTYQIDQLKEVMERHGAVETRIP